MYLHTKKIWVRCSSENPHRNQLHILKQEQVCLQIPRAQRFQQYRRQSKSLGNCKNVKIHIQSMSLPPKKEFPMYRVYIIANLFEGQIISSYDTEVMSL